MASTYSLKVSNPSIDGTTGHHRIEAQILERAGDATIQGVRETYGIDLAALKSQFGEDPEKWLQWVAQDMFRKHLNRMEVHKEIAAWEGREITLATSA